MKVKHVLAGGASRESACLPWVVMVKALGTAATQAAIAGRHRG
jgi:hypothetical protein